jgi:hypothetical protein
MVFDYSQYIINIQHAQKACHDALLKKDYHLAQEAAQHIILAASLITHYCQVNLPESWQESPPH